MNRVLGTSHLTALGVNAIIGAGIFMVPGKLAEYLGPWSVVMFIGCGLLLHMIALSFARLSRLTDRNGGPYIYASMAFGNKIGFIVGWTAWIAAVVSCGAVANAVGFYLSHFFGEATNVELLAKVIALGCIAFFGAINYFGVQYGGSATVVITVLKFIPLLAIALFSIFHWNANIIPTESFKISQQGLSLALMMALFTCQGFEVVPIIAGEAKKPTQIVPTATVASLWICIILYVVLQMGIVCGPAIGSDKPLADQAVFLWGTTGGNIVALAGLFSVVGFVAGIALGAPRFLSPLCEDGLLPKYFAQIHPKFGTPSRAVALTTIAALIVTAPADITSLISLSALSVALQYCVSAVALIVLVKKQNAKGLYVGIAALAVSLFFLYHVPGKSWIAFTVLTAIGFALHLAYMKTQSGKATT